MRLDEPEGHLDFVAFTSGVELDEAYGELCEDWNLLYDRAFAIISEPGLLKAAEDLDASFEAFGDRMAGLPMTPITDRVVELEEQALMSIAQMYKQLASLPGTSAVSNSESAVKYLVAAGAAHEEARAAVSRYLASLGLDFGA